ncbi:unnamed protein product [Rotaria magnacalcarata]|uniref:Uncharacterized protein n=1 Tax=Rotaria magnacalcarata TaxID=392030 RepID=A0A816SMH8_9BILA|nr:unnamed protein product [Rotaria magnacalcarata]CAF3816717.1 unnamed protein product [Rotaria magnacalcarata]
MNNESESPGPAYNQIPPSNLPVTDTEAIQIDAKDTSLPRKTAADRVAEQFAEISMRATTAAVMTPSTADILQALSYHLQNKFFLRICFSLLAMLLLITASIILFATKRGTGAGDTAYILQLLFGLVFIMLAFCASIMLIVSYCQRKQPISAALGNIRYTIRIEGGQWVRFVNYFFSSKGRPSRARGWWFCGGDSIGYYMSLLEFIQLIFLLKNLSNI